MSVEYWRMKLSGCFVKYKGEYLQIDGISSDEETRFDEDGDPIYPDENVFPEETLPHMRFNLADKRGGHHQVKYKDFEIKFPHDQWVSHQGKAQRFHRSMGRQIRIAPCNDSVVRERGATASMDALLTLCDEPQYDKPEAIMTWGPEDLVFSEHMALIRKSRYTRELFYYNTKIGELTRTETTGKLNWSRERVPKVAKQMWNDFIDKELPYDPSTLITDVLELGGLRYNWLRGPAEGDMGNTSFHFRITEGHEGAEVCQLVDHEGRTYFFYDLADIDLCIMDFNFEPILRSDVRHIMLTEMVLEPQEMDEDEAY